MPNGRDLLEVAGHRVDHRANYIADARRRIEQVRDLAETGDLLPEERAAPVG